MAKMWLQLNNSSQCRSYSKYRLCFLGVSLVLAATALPAIAEYKPPKKRSAPSGTITSTGTRGGCSDQSKTALTAIAPTKHIGQTASSHPTFVWHVPDPDPHPLIFQLYELSSTGEQLIYTTQLQSTPGMMQLPLPKDEAGLSTGRRYTWQVVLLCEPNRPSTALRSGADIEAITLPSSLSAQLATAQSPEERMTLYAQAGFWYDALAEITQPQFAEQRTTLIRALAAMETGTNPDNGQGKKLQQILETEQLSQN